MQSIFLMYSANIEEEVKNSMQSRRSEVQRSGAIWCRDVINHPNEFIRAKK